MHQNLTSNLQIIGSFVIQKY